MAAGQRHQTLKQSPSQHSFDSAILEGSLPDESLSVDSDISDNFFTFIDSGIKNFGFNLVAFILIRLAHLFIKKPLNF